MFAQAHQPMWTGTEDLQDHTITSVRKINAAPDTTPTICRWCGSVIRPYGGDRYKEDLCESCFQHGRFETAANADVDKAIKARL